MHDLPIAHGLTMASMQNEAVRRTTASVCRMNTFENGWFWEQREPVWWILRMSILAGVSREFGADLRSMWQRCLQISESGQYVEYLSNAADEVH